MASSGINTKNLNASAGRIEIISKGDSAYGMFIRNGLTVDYCDIDIDSRGTSGTGGSAILGDGSAKFKLNGGSITAISEEVAVYAEGGITLADGLTITAPSTGTSPGKLSTDKKKIVKSDDTDATDVKIRQNLSYVQFDMNRVEGTPPDPAFLNVEKGSKISKPNDPEADGYDFGGWFTDKYCTSEWDFQNDKVDTNHLIIRDCGGLQ